ncbi:conserved hypothetical protein [Verticillium alfalfae VaMs.102]|uniref:Myb-like domain-containing protein n=1 Tax=Verticillium alfalfae (strain VaMs.102 / ATCC MYA-4576 / FGSC 10136) TaxID=526221 RepID=C9S9B6_VERA1|nr:conserved hypothetical protein [Verticillium alfalfae VaMs.102]EEY15979.1 conserved hypothetical protein [Verticillium alfalfae VaMs.102]
MLTKLKCEEGAGPATVKKTVARPSAELQLLGCWSENGKWVRSSSAEGKEASEPVSSYDPPARRAAPMVGDRAQSINLDNIQPSIAANSDYDAYSQSNVDDEEDEPSNVRHASSAGDESEEGIVDPLQLDNEAIELQTLVLRDINQASEALIDQIFRDQKPRHEVWKRLIAVHRKPFTEFRRMYVDDSVPLIDIQGSADRLGKDVQKQAQAIFASVNLASLLDEICGLSLDPTALLQRLDQDFPAPFMPFFHEMIDEGVEWNVDGKIVRLALSIRTQRLICAIENKQDFDIERTVAAIFSIDDDAQEPDELLTPENMAGICCLKQPLENAIATACHDRVKDILETARQAQSTADIIRHLKERFPPQGWVSDQIDWALEQFQEVQRTIQDDLHTAASNREASRSVAGSQGSQQVIRPRTSGQQLPITNSAVARLMQLGEAAGVSQDAYGPASFGNAYDGPRSPQYGRNSPLNVPGSPTSTTSDMYENAILRQLPSSSRQTSSQAHVVGSQTQLPAASSFRSANSNNDGNRKRARAQDDDVFETDDVDDDFEQDEREPDERRRAEDRRAMPPPPSKRSRHDTLPSSATLVGSSAPLPRRHAVPDHSRAFDQRDPENPNDEDGRSHTASSFSSSAIHADYRDIQKRNRNSTPTTPRVQHRVPWSNRDVSKLIDLIATLGCNWSLIEQGANPRTGQSTKDEEPTGYDPERHFEDRRGQQAIRDKARNLKVDFLKADIVLPPGFDRVLLGTKEVKALTGRGKNPYRRERDVDADGNPTNTEYYEE